MSDEQRPTYFEHYKRCAEGKRGALLNSRDLAEWIEYTETLEARNRELEGEYHTLAQAVIDVITAAGYADDLKAEFERRGLGDLLKDKRST